MASGHIICAVKFPLRINRSCRRRSQNPDGETPYNAQNYPIICEYRAKVVAAGSWAAYERAHRARLTKVLEPKFPQIPAEIVPTIVAYAFHTGLY